METPETIRTSLQQAEWITSVDFQDAYVHIPIQEQSRKYLIFQTVHSSHVVYSDSKGGKPDGHTLGYKDLQIPRQLVGESQIPPSLSPAYTGSSKMCQELGRLVNLEKLELVQPTPGQWQNLQQNVLALLS